MSGQREKHWSKRVSQWSRDGGLVVKGGGVVVKEDRSMVKVGGGWRSKKCRMFISVLNLKYIVSPSKNKVVHFWSVAYL